MTTFSGDSTRTEMEEARHHLKVALAKARECNEARDRDQAALGRTDAKKTLLLEDLKSAETAYAADARRVADSLKGGGEVLNLKNPKKAVADIEVQLSNLAAAREILEADVAAATAGLEELSAEVQAAIDEVLANHMLGVLTHAQGLYDELHSIVPMLHLARSWRLQVEGLWPFLTLPGNGPISSRATASIIASALLRSWKTALAENPNAQPDLAAAEVLIKAEAAREEAARREEAAEEAAWRAEMAEASRAAEEARPKYKYSPPASPMNASPGFPESLKDLV